MLNIDGSHGEGGGQIVRSAVALSVAFKKEIRITNIRAGRKQPGLKMQHLYALRALQEFTSAKVRGLELGSTELEFSPRKWSRKEVVVRIPTAGSIGLVLQALVPALITAPFPAIVRFQGGATCGKWSPPLDFITNVLFPDLRLFGIKSPQVNVLQEGYYPKGGAVVDVKVFPSSPHPAKILERGKIIRIRGISHASLLLRERKVAERQAIRGIQIRYSPSLSPGSCLTLWAECENTIIGADALGQRGKRAEDVKKEAWQNLQQELRQGAFDSHTTDMLIPFIALAGRGEITSSKITSHTLTNIWLCEQFTKKKFRIKGNLISY